jgi:hypothetical protein
MTRSLRREFLIEDKFLETQMATAAAYLDTERKGHDAVFVLSQYKIKKKLGLKICCVVNSRCGNDPFITKTLFGKKSLVLIFFVWRSSAAAARSTACAGYFVFFFCCLVLFYDHRRRVYCDRESVVLQSKNAETFSPSRWERHET